MDTPTKGKAYGYLTLTEGKTGKVITTTARSLPLLFISCLNVIQSQVTIIVCLKSQGFILYCINNLFKDLWHLLVLYNKKEILR